MSEKAAPYFDQDVVVAAVWRSFEKVKAKLARGDIPRWLKFVLDTKPDRPYLTTAQALDVDQELIRLLTHAAFSRGEFQRVVLARIVWPYVLQRRRLCTSGMIKRVCEIELGNIAQHVSNIRRHLAVCNREPGGRARILFLTGAPKGQAYVPKVVFADPDGKFHLPVAEPERLVRFSYRSADLACHIAERLGERSDRVLIAGRTAQPLLFEPCLTEAVVDPRRQGELSILLLDQDLAPHDKKLARSWRLLAVWAATAPFGAFTPAAHDDTSLTATIVEIGQSIFVNIPEAGSNKTTPDVRFEELRNGDMLYDQIEIMIPQKQRLYPLRLFARD